MTRDLALTLRSRAIAAKLHAPSEEERRRFDPRVHEAPPGDWISVASAVVKKRVSTGKKTLLAITLTIETALTTGNESFVGHQLLYFVDFDPDYDDTNLAYAFVVAARNAVCEIAGLKTWTADSLDLLPHLLEGKRIRHSTRITRSGFFSVANLRAERRNIP